MPVSQKISVSWRSESQNKHVCEADYCCHRENMTITLTIFYFDSPRIELVQRCLNNWWKDKWLVSGLKGYLNWFPPAFSTAWRLHALLTEEWVCCRNQLMTVMPQVNLQWWGKILKKKIITKVIKQDDQEEPDCCMAGVSVSVCSRAGLRCTASDGADVLRWCRCQFLSCPPLQWVGYSYAKGTSSVGSE